MPKDRLRPDLAFTHCDQGLSCQAAPSISSHVFLAWNAVAKSTCLPSHWLKLSTLDGDSHRYTPDPGAACEANDSTPIAAPHSSGSTASLRGRDPAPPEYFKRVLRDQGRAQ